MYIKYFFQEKKYYIQKKYFFKTKYKILFPKKYNKYEVKDPFYKVFKKHKNTRYVQTL